jgi:NADPH2:quinone reductase
MQAAFIEQPGPPESIIYGEFPKPKPTGKQVLVRVEAVAVNPVDTYIRSGMYPMELPQPFVVGCDLAGVVEAVGSEADRYQPGDRVWGTNQGMLGRQGTFAEYAAIDEHWLYPTPEALPSTAVAAVAMVGITAHLGTFRDAQLKMGETLFVNGGTGGVGSCVVQMARTVGARVITTAGSDQKVKACKQLGAHLAVNHQTDDVGAAIRRFAPDGVDVWFETLREPNLENPFCRGEVTRLRERLAIVGKRTRVLR